MVAVDEEACNPPVGRSQIQLAIAAHTARELDWGSELTPANNIPPNIDEGRWDLSARTSLSLSAMCFPDHSFSSLRFRWKAVHQQPPQTPLCFSTARSKSGHVCDPSSRTERYALDAFPSFRSDPGSPLEPTREVVGFFFIWISTPCRFYEYDSSERIPPRLRDASRVYDFLSPENFSQLL